MGTRTVVFGFVIVFFCGATGGAFFEGQLARKARAEQAVFSQRTAFLERELQTRKAQQGTVEQLAGAAEEQCRALQKQVDESLKKQVSTLGSGPITSVQSPAKSKVIDQLELMSTNPEYQKLYLENQRLSEGQYYARLYKKLGLTPQQITIFEELLIAQQQASFDVRAAAYSQGLKPTDSAFRKIKNPVAEELEAKMVGLLGEDGFRQYKNYPKEMGGPVARGTARSLAAMLFFTETPLSVDQSDSLIRVIDANVTQRRPRQEVNWDAVYNQAKGVLLPSQLSALKYDREGAKIDRQMQEFADKVADSKP